MPRLFVSACLVLAFAAGRVCAQSVALAAGGATLDVTFSGAVSPPVQAAAVAWTERAARAVTVYYGRFPVAHVRILLRVGRRPGSGRTSGEDGAHISVTVGSELRDGRLAVRGDDWIMTHEMVHLALPGMRREHHWLEEGLATYVEPIARVRAGELPADRVWADMMDGMPKGEPEAGDQGLDGTPSWGRTYWGGAIFCLLADVGFREATHNRAGLEAALRGILQAGGSIEQDWPIERVLEVGDRSAGAAVLRPLYQRMRSDPMPVDLEGLWLRLGLRRQGGTVIFDDSAPLAAVRRAIMSP
jgi:hypothetical protein